MKIYYAHCIAIYDTPQEARDVAMLEALGFEVVNPNSQEVDDAMEILPPAERMAWFERYADICDAIAFRGLPLSPNIPSGVAQEIQWFLARKKPVIELPWGLLDRSMTLDQTRRYLYEVGER